MMEPNADMLNIMDGQVNKHAELRINGSSMQGVVEGQGFACSHRVFW